MSKATVETLPGETTTGEASQSDTKEIKVGSSVTNDEVKISYKTCNTDLKKYPSYADICQINGNSLSHRQVHIEFYSVKHIELLFSNISTRQWL